MMRRLMSALAGLVGLIALTIGAPWGLWQWGRPLPLKMSVWLRPDDGSALLGLLTVAGWAAWGILMAALVLEVVSRVTTLRLRLPGCGWAHGLVAPLVVAILGAPLAVAPAANAAPAPMPVAASVASTTVAASVPTHAATPSGLTHVVEPGESLWTIAEEHYGDGLRWREIYEANRDQIRDPGVIEPGWSLAVPGIAATPAVAPTVRPLASKPVSTPVPATSTSVSTPAPATPQPVQVTVDAGAQPSAIATPSVAAPTLSPEQGVQEVAAPEAPRPAALALGAGLILTGGVLVMASARRTRRELHRPVGRRFVRARDAATRLETVFATAEDPLGVAELDAAQRAIAVHARERELPRLDHVLVGTQISFVFADDPGEPPVGFTRLGCTWRVNRGGLGFLATEGDLAWPSLMTVGARPDGSWLLVDATEACVGLDPGVDGILEAWLLELATREVTVVTTGALAPLVAGARLESAVVFDSAAEVASWLRARARGMGDATRADRWQPDRAEALRPVVALLPEPPDREVVASLRASAQAASIGVVMPTTAPVQVHERDGQWRCVTETTRLDVQPQRLDPHTVDACVGLLADAEDTTTEPAWWWADSIDNVTWLPPRPVSGLLADLKENPVTDPPLHPTLLLLGPIELRGARGPEPSRARRQCIEYAAWLLEHPGGTASQMSDALVVAETTRRSNMSRLRTWLGTCDDGDEYLPDAYSGRIRLHELVSSDWREVTLMLRPGVNRVPAATLAQALGMVRGAPLADAAPTQWGWAEEMRSDMRALLRDAALRLAELALDDDDLDLVRWATGRGLTASPMDEQLLCARVRAEQKAGDRDEIQRLALMMDRHAKDVGVDLDDETVILLQEAIEGAPRARRAWMS